MMYEKYAELTRCMHAAMATRKTAKDEYDEALKEREILIRDFEIGTHTVSGGEVVVSIAYDTAKHVKFIEIDKKTQEFASCYARHYRNVADARVRVNKAVKSCGSLEKRRDAYWHKFQDQLVDGKYAVEGGTITITNGKVTFTEEHGNV